MLAFGDPVYSGDDDRVVRKHAFEPPLAAAIGPYVSAARFQPDRDGDGFRGHPAQQTKSFTGFAATRERFLAEIRGASGLVLVSTHVLVNDDQPALSSIVFSMVDQEGKTRDGLVHLYDLTNGKLKLKSALVVLSTCDGAGGQELELEGLQSLARGFILAGAGSVIASVTKVDAEGTAYFVRGFLQSLLGPSHGQADQAMLAARRKAAESKRWKDPYFWSTFVMTGGVDRKQYIK